MNKPLLYIALALALAMTLVHVFVGGRLIAGPLLDSGLASLPKFTLYACWHGITIALALLAALYADSLFWRRRRDSALLASAIAAAFAALVLLVALSFGLAATALPQWVVLGPMAASGFAGAQPRK